MFCTKCGKETENGTLFCPNCGERLQDTALSVIRLDNSKTPREVPTHGAPDYCFSQYLIPESGLNSVLMYPSPESTRK